MELHRTVGPAATTVTGIAERAGVGRVTVYRHFPDDPTLERASTRLYLERNPLPDPAGWETVQDPVERLRTALADVYAYYRPNEEMLARLHVVARDTGATAPYHADLQRTADALLEPWPAQGSDRVLLRAAIGLALGFDTWRSLTRDHGLSDERAIELMLRVTTGEQAPAGAAPRTAPAPTPTSAVTGSRPLPSSRRE